MSYVRVYAVWTNDLLIDVMIANYFIKVGWEVSATPMTWQVIGFLKRTEHEDFYDRDTDFMPFSIEV